MLLDINSMQFRVIFCFKEVKPYVFYNPYNNTINVVFRKPNCSEISTDNYEIKEKLWNWIIILMDLAGRLHSQRIFICFI